tara:strand:+ start:126 stop:470 length:345 start_codon:yes stop_codon:yes gene_type:complete
MNIAEFSNKPKLVEIKLDEKDLLEKYGDPITFHTYDVVGMSTYFNFFNARSEGEYENLGNLMKQMILDKDGNPALKDDEDLPIDIAASAINKLGEILGKSQSKTSTPTAGKQTK